MPLDSRLPAFLRSRQAQILTVVLMVQAGVFYSMSGGEKVPLNLPLRAFPTMVKDWKLLQEGIVEKEIMDVLRADDVLTRVYARPSADRAANLFVAYFKSQRTGQAPHSPKNCLPGAGWVPSASGMITVSIPGESKPITINRYLVAKGDEKSVVLYWYQTHNRVIASEYMAKLYLVADAIRYNRTDTAMIRVVVPVFDNQETPATEAAVEFVQSFFTTLRQYLPA